MKSPPPPDPPDEPYMEQQQHPVKGAAELKLTPTSIDRSSENPATSETLPTQNDPQALESREITEIEGATEPDVIDTSPTEQTDYIIDPPQDERGAGLWGNEPKNLPQSLSTFLHLSRGRIEDLTSLLSELSGTPLTTEITTNWLGLEPQGTVDSHDSPSKKLLDGLWEDLEDDPMEFIPIIEQHNARLEKAHLLLEATQASSIKNGRRARL